MNIFRDKQNQYLGIFLLFFTLLVLLLGAGFLNLREQAAWRLVFIQNNRIATSLLEQGVSPEVIAEALTGTTSSEEGAALLTLCGLSETLSPDYLPYITSYRNLTGQILLPVGILLILLLWGGLFLFLYRRETLYLQAGHVINRFIEEDYSCRLPQLREGTVYQLFASIEQLFTILRSKNDTSLQIREFMKNTISDISHQLKTPLTALSMYQEIIAAEPEQAETVREFSIKTGTALKRMELLIQSLLKITRLDAGTVLFEPGACDVRELITAAGADLTTRAAGEGKEIIVAESPAETLRCDRHWTAEAIGNLIKNALDHTGPGGQIHISWYRSPAMLRILVSDNGSGILPEDYYHIFKRFYRSKSSLDTPGIGLGLPLAQSIIEGQGGLISVSSTPNTGTTFTLSFLTKP